MSWRQWQDWEYTAPRRPANGIRAKTQRGKFGATWWAGRWLAALEQLVDGGRLSRGRSYARSGQVTRLDVGPEGVSADVQGSRPYPYEVAIEFTRLSDAEWDAVIDAMAGQAIFAARLLSGEMPEQIEDAFRAAGVSLFPARSGDLQSDCTCPDWANPCKHVAAVFYLLGERFDDDPFLIFVLRGRTKEQIVGALRERRAGAATDGAGQPAASAETIGDEPGRRYVDEEAPLPALGAGVEPQVADAFWSAAIDLDEMSFDFRAPPVDALPAKLRGRPPPWPATVDFEATAEHAYRAIGERAQRLLEGT